jgi:PKHD-type hydroxylase
MQYLLTPYAARDPAPYVWWEGAFSEQELDWLQEKAKQADTNAEIGSGSNSSVSSNVRRSQVSWLVNSVETGWVFEKLADIVANINAKHYHFDLTGFGESIQLANYNQSENGMYGWHQDFGGKISRKLSMAVQLTDPAQYEGGNLQIMPSLNIETVRKQRGLIAVFPSYAVHQVTPVTQGSRQSLVAWVSGPPFK